VSATAAVPATNSNAGAQSQPSVQHLDELLAKRPAELLEIYRSASVPRIDDLQGDLRGRMLGFNKEIPLFKDLTRTVASQDWFPWRGKSFSSEGQAPTGEGINRLFVDRNKWFRFETSVGPSRAGNFDAVQLNYDLPENPFFIRAIKDEIREVRPGLYLGQAYARVLGRDNLVLYFGLQDPSRI
jgi:hypothetical protein